MAFDDLCFILHNPYNYPPLSTQFNSESDLDNLVSVFFSNLPFFYPSNHSVIHIIGLSLIFDIKILL